MNDVYQIQQFLVKLSTESIFLSANDFKGSSSVSKNVKIEHRKDGWGLFDGDQIPSSADFTDFQHFSLLLRNSV